MDKRSQAGYSPRGQQELDTTEGLNNNKPMRMAFEIRHNFSSKESACNDLGSIPGLGRSSGEENGNPLQCSCLENSMDRGARWATVHGVAKSEHF